MRPRPGSGTGLDGIAPCESCPCKRGPRPPCYRCAGSPRRKGLPSERGHGMLRLDSSGRPAPVSPLPVVDFVGAGTVRHGRSGAGLCGTCVRPDPRIRLGVARNVAVVAGVVRDNQGQRCCVNVRFPASRPKRAEIRKTQQRLVSTHRNQGPRISDPSLLRLRVPPTPPRGRSGASSSPVGGPPPFEQPAPAPDVSSAASPQILGRRRQCSLGPP